MLVPVPTFVLLTLPDYPAASLSVWACSLHLFRNRSQQEHSRELRVSERAAARLASRCASMSTTRSRRFLGFLFVHWADAAHDQREARDRAVEAQHKAEVAQRRALRHWVNAAVRRPFAAWVAHHVRAQQSKRIIKMAIRRWRHQRLSRAFRVWHDAAEDAARTPLVQPLAQPQPLPQSLPQPLPQPLMSADMACGSSPPRSPLRFGDSDNSDDDSDRQLLASAAAAVGGRSFMSWRGVENDMHDTLDLETIRLIGGASININTNVDRGSPLKKRDQGRALFLLRNVLARWRDQTSVVSRVRTQALFRASARR